MNRNDWIGRRRAGHRRAGRRPRLLELLVPILLASMVALPSCTGDSRPTPAEAKAFLEAAEARILESWITEARADWVQSNFITFDTEILAAEAREQRIATATELARGATRFAGLQLDEETRRKLDLIRLSLNLPAPDDPAERAELARIAARLKASYGAGQYCPKDGRECLELEDLETIMDTSRDPAQLLDAWRGWRTTSVPMRADYERFVELANRGAQGLGFADLGEMWRSNYDMDPAAFSAELERLWQQIKPMYEALHCHVRAKLVERHGSDVLPPRGPIPAHLLGNMWAQSWANIYPLVAPPGGTPAYDLTELLRAKGVDELEMVRYAERFFVSLGFEPLPETFWERSLFVKPRDRSVVCHASAWDIDYAGDLRIKMCIEVTAEDFATVHHELGHNFYQRAYDHLSPLFRSSANDGFHEAVGDVLALSVTPGYLVDVGLLEREPDSSADLGLLMQMALDRLAFLPFGLVVDQWRYKVFSGEISPDGMNAGWWQLREAYQGVAPPVERSEADFDPGAKYHVPANTPYSRYFLAHILQFQMHRDLCAAAGYEGPLHRCSIYGNQAAGERLRKMLAMGQSRPWPEALAVVSGKGEMDATAIQDYFAPLKDWLDEQNQGRTCGW